MSTNPTLLLSLVLAAAAPAQGLLQDIKVQALDQSLGSKPGSFVRLGKHVYFHAEDEAHGRELWRSDGQASGTDLVLDLRPGRGDSLSSWTKLFVMGNRLVFAAQGPTGPGLFASDGTAAGTQQLAAVTIRGDRAGEQVLEGSRLWFYGHTQSHGTELWVSDGTAAGTRRVTDIQPGAASSVPNNRPPLPMAVLGGKAFFQADDGQSGLEPWVSDGSAAGTFRLIDANPGALGSSPDAFFVYGSQVVFAARPVLPGPPRLFFTDGSKAGTRMIPGVENRSVSAGDYCQLGKLLLFPGMDQSHGIELWVSDGTAAGTKLLKNLKSGIKGSFPEQFCVLGARAYFVASDDQHGRELWSSDGSAQGTTLVKDIAPGSLGGSVNWPTVVGSKLVFAARSGSSAGVELWISDGSAAGTRQLKDLAAAALSSSPAWLSALGPDELWFSAQDGQGGVEPYRSDLSAAGTHKVADLAASTFGSRPGGFVTVGYRALFAAEPNASSRLPFATDGSAAGTGRYLKHLVGSGWLAAPGVCRYGNEVFVSFNEHLLRTDPWLQSTQLLDRVSGMREELAQAGGKLYFGARTELWVSDRSLGGARKVTDFNKSAFYPAGPHLWEVVGDRPYFLAAEGQGLKSGVWTTDGTLAGTKLLVNAPVGGLAGSRVWLEVLDDQLIVMVRQGYNFLLYSVQGTKVQRIATVLDSAQRQVPVELCRAGKRVYFAAGDPGTGTELWSTDGTTAGTAMVKDIWTGADASSPAEFCAAGELCYFVAGTAAAGRELWVSDGSLTGTRQVVDIWPGVASSGIEEIFHLGGGHLVFAAALPASGRELWHSDGSASGTAMVADRRPGARGSFPHSFARLGSSLLLVLDDGIHGPEPHVLALRELGVPVADEIGLGCAGAQGQHPRLFSSTLPRLGAKGFGFELENARSNAALAVWLAADSAPFELQGCMLHTSAALVTLVGGTDQHGRAKLPVALPSNPSLLGLAALAQALVVDPQGSFLGGASLSGGLWLQVGR